MLVTLRKNRVLAADGNPTNARVVATAFESEVAPGAIGPTVSGARFGLTFRRRFDRDQTPPGQEGHSSQSLFVLHTELLERPVTH